jgi:hypothetical protein
MQGCRIEMWFPSTSCGVLGRLDVIRMEIVGYIFLERYDDPSLRSVVSHRFPTVYSAVALVMDGNSFQAGDEIISQRRR